MGEAFRFRDFKTGIEDLDKLIEAQVKADAGLGFPLKMITVNTSIDKKGNAKENEPPAMEVLSWAARISRPPFSRSRPAMKRSRWGSAEKKNR